MSVRVMAGRYVVALQRPSLVLLRVVPRAQRQLQDEHLARLGNTPDAQGAIVTC